MADHKLDHPGAAQLSAFGLGQLDAAEAAEVERHVATCSACCQTLWTLPDDRLVTLLRQSFTAPPTSEATTLLPSAAPPSSSALSVPAELAEHPRYRIVEALGAGGMGVVYKAEHRLMERLVALKVIDRSLTSNPAVVERFRREVKAAGALIHPNIVQAYDAEQAGDSHFLVMEYVEGTTLARLVERDGPLPVARACDAIRQAARGLQRAHESGLVHRDIKPHNLMLTPQGVVKILDFGLARLAREATPSLPTSADTSAPEAAGAAGLTQLGMVMGTADYMAPEQADDAHTADIRADIYSLGCTLYFLLSGQPPFPEGTMLDKLLAHRQGTIRPLSDFRNDIPPELARVIQRMMDRDPARRYQTPAELAEALRPFLAAPKRRPWRVAAIVLLLVALAIGAMSVLVCGGVAMYWWQSGGGPMATTTLLQEFPPGQKLLDASVVVEPDGWRIEAKEPRTVRLFEVSGLDVENNRAIVENCRVIYQAKMKTEKLQGQAYLEMWCRDSVFGEFFSRDLQHPVSGTTDWASYETPFFLKQGQRADLIKLNVVIEGTGTLWIKDVSLRKGPLPLGF